MANHYDIVLDRLVTVLQTNIASLSRITDATEIVKRRDWLSAGGVPHLGITVHKGKRRIGDGGPFGIDDFIYPCYITHVVGTGFDDYDADEAGHEVQDLVTRLWHAQRCGVSFSATNSNTVEHSCMVQDGDLLVPREHAESFSVTSIVVHVELRQERSAL